MDVLRKDWVKEICDGDLSVTDNRSLYLTEGCAAALYYGETASGFPPEAYSAEWIHKTFMTTVELDVLILQRMILGVYETELDEITLDASGLRQLNAIKRELLLA
jgi:hypothetical protein